MASKRSKTTKKSKGTKKGGKNKKSDVTAELRTMIEILKKEIDSMKSTIKKQEKRIKSLEVDHKRTAKHIRKLAMQSTTNLNLEKAIPGSPTKEYIPLPSKTTPTSSFDMEQSDVESKEESPSPSPPPNPAKKEEKKQKSREPKVVARRNRKPPKVRSDSIKFGFDLSHPGKIKTFENGSVAMKPQSAAGTIRFGRFLHFTKNNNQKIASYRITFDTQAIGQSSTLALGFATKSFTGWNGSNFGDNNCCFVKGNGQFVTTQGVFTCVEGKEYKHKQVIKGILNADNPRDGFFKDGHDMTVEVDLKNHIGKMWNEKLNKDGSDGDRVFVIGLPAEKEVCIVAYMGGAKKKKLVVRDQHFVLADEDES